MCKYSDVTASNINISSHQKVTSISDYDVKLRLGQEFIKDSKIIKALLIEQYSNSLKDIL